jgi:hypothetical protein
MDQTDFAIVMVSGVLIIIAIFLFILFRIFEKKKKTSHILTLLPEITKIETHETEPGKFEIKPQEIEGLEKEFQLAREQQKKGSGIEIMGEKREYISSVFPEKTIVPLKETQISTGIKETLKESSMPIKEISLSQPVFQSIEENRKLKLEDILIEVRNENTKKKVKKTSSSRKNLEKVEKKPTIKPFRNKIEKDQSPEQVSKVYEEKSSGKKPGKKVSKIKKIQSIVNENSA